MIRALLLLAFAAPAFAQVTPNAVGSVTINGMSRISATEVH